MSSASAPAKSSPPVSTRRRRPRIHAASACGLQSSPPGDVGASRASSARSLLCMQIMVQRRQRHSNMLQLCSSGPTRAASARHGSHMRTRATTACRRPEERASSFYVRLEISAMTSATTTRVRDAILPAEEEGFIFRSVALPSPEGFHRKTSLRTLRSSPRLATRRTL